MKSILKKILLSEKRVDDIVIVSGLPRCGTSMMMQMLEAGGISPMTDHIRKADEDNPKGYYEFEKVKNIKEDASWLERCYGKAFKMVSALLYYLPNDKRYKVIFMKREMAEMLASQNKMLQIKGQESDTVSDGDMSKKLYKHLHNIEEWLANQNNIDVIYINYNDVIKKPYENAKLVSQFVNGRLDVDKMTGSVKTSLYRQRKRILAPSHEKHD
jgi:hypothetical protein